MDEIIDDPTVGWVSSDDIDTVIAQVCESASGGKWKRDAQLDLGAKRWRPAAVSDDQTELLYVFLQDELPRFAVDRLRLAATLNIRSSVALRLASLFKADVVELLVEIDASVLVVDDYVEDRRLKPRLLMAALADVEVPVDPDLRRRIGDLVWSRIADGTAQAKGRRLEALLAFLFSQIRDLKVVERNFRNESEEIDLVLQIDNFSSRAWQKPGVPFVLVEAKNRVDKASQQMMSTLITKLQTKRGTARIALMVSLAGFTEDAKIQELRFSTQELCVVMLDGSHIEALLKAGDVDEMLETFVRRALLR